MGGEGEGREGIGKGKKGQVRGGEVDREMEGREGGAHDKCEAKV